MKRRSFLSVVGAMMAAPTLLVEEVAQAAPRIGMPNLFDIPMAEFKPGQLTSIIGLHGSGKTALMRSVAMQAARNSSVGFIGQNYDKKLSLNNKTFSGNLHLYSDSDLKPNQLDEIFDKHDVIIIDDLYDVVGPSENFNQTAYWLVQYSHYIHNLAIKNGNHVVISATTRSCQWTALSDKIEQTPAFLKQFLKHFSSNVYKLEKESDKFSAIQTKNRYPGKTDFTFKVRPNLTAEVDFSIYLGPV